MITKTESNYPPAEKLVVLILREAGRTESLRAQIRRTGGRAVSLPAFHFETLFNCKPAINFLRDPQKFHRLFFAGPHGIISLRQMAAHHRLQLPLNITCAAPGQASRKALLSAGFTNIIAPPGVGDFETMLRSNSLGNLEGKRVALAQRQDAPVRAGQHLHRLKCIVVPLQCYKRVRNSDSFWAQLNEDLRGDINSILAFDTPSLQVLLEESKDCERLRRLPLGVIHRNIQEKAQAMGYENIIVSGNSEEMLAKLLKMVNTPQQSAVKRMGLAPDSRQTSD